MMDDLQYFKDCRRRHYENMSSMRAKALMRTLTKAKKAIFIKRINYAKGYEFVKNN